MSIINSPLSGNLLGSLIYEIMSLGGNATSMLSWQQMASYSNYTLNVVNGIYGWVQPSDQYKILVSYPGNGANDTNAALYEILRQSYANGNSYWIKEGSKTDYNTSIQQNGILGFSFLPWDTYYTPTNDPNVYNAMHLYGSDTTLKLFNPLSGHSLLLKGQSLLTIFILFFLLRIGYKMLRRRL